MEDHEHRRDDKYAVLRREDWDAIQEESVHHSTVSELDDTVVIKLTDIFAAPALSAYASTIQAVANGLSSTFEDMGFSEDAECGAMVARLKHVADYFHDRASEIHDVKMPD